MFVRILSLIVVVGFLSFREGRAVGPEKENSPPTSGIKRKQEAENDKKYQSPVKRSKHEDETVPIFSPLLENSPTTAEQKFWLTSRCQLALEKHKRGKTKATVESPVVRKIYKKHDTGNFFECVRILGKTVFKTDHLFDPEALVLSKSGIWETNLVRMATGRSPIGHRGIASQDEKTSLPSDAIRRKQIDYRIDLQHITQKDTGTDDDPICEMTHAAHMGLNARLILQEDLETQEIQIIASGLTKEVALSLLVPGQVITTNTLHFRTGPSLINRSSFGKWRTEYWMERAAEITKGNFKKTPPRRILKAKFFS